MLLTWPFRVRFKPAICLSQPRRTHTHTSDHLPNFSSRLGSRSRRPFRLLFLSVLLLLRPPPSLSICAFLPPSRPCLVGLPSAVSRTPPCPPSPGSSSGRKLAITSPVTVRPPFSPSRSFYPNQPSTKTYIHPRSPKVRPALRCCVRQPRPRRVRTQERATHQLCPQRRPPVTCRVRRRERGRRQVPHRPGRGRQCAEVSLFPTRLCMSRHLMTKRVRLPRRLSNEKHKSSGLAVGASGQSSIHSFVHFASSTLVSSSMTISIER